MNEVNSQKGVPFPPEPAGQAKQGGRHRPALIVAAVFVLLAMLSLTFLFGTCFFFALSFRRAEGEGVGLVRIDGIITSGGTVSGTSAEEVVQELHQAQENKNIKAIILRINSPGGTPAASQEVVREIRRTIKKGKPVVASVGDICASGAYYIASSSDFIFANTDSDVGSIGVIVEIPNLEELNKKIGVDFTVLTEGKFKDIGSPLREVTQEEKDIITAQMKMAYDNFIKDVAKGRKISESRVRELANGLTYPGKQAKELGLIDSIGNFRDAIEKAGRLGGIKGEVRVIELERRSFFGSLGEFLTSAKELLREVRLLVGGYSVEQSVPVKK